MTMLGTDLLIGGVQTADDLAAALCKELDIQKAQVYQAKLFEWEQLPSPHGAAGCYFSDIGRCNTILIRELTGAGPIRFIVEVEFLTPIPLTSLQRLSDEHGLCVGLSRDTAFPQDIGTSSAEHYILFRPETAPRLSIVLENAEDAHRMSWGVLNQPLPTLPDVLLPGDG